MMMAELPGIQKMYFGGDRVNRNMDWLKDLDTEWIQLIMEAKNLGIDISTVREFLNGNEAKELLIGK